MAYYDGEETNFDEDWDIRCPDREEMDAEENNNDVEED